MATTIQSGYADSPKLTANIADHADVYGGRALVFDGVSDYLQLPEPILTTNHSISFWMYVADTLNGMMPFSEEDSHSDGVYIYLYNNQIYYRVNSVEKTEALSYRSKWTHICCTYDGSTMNIYADGEALGNGVSNSTNLNVTTAGEIGNRSFTNQYYFNGKMCDFKIFDTALTEAQVQELYKKPENTPSAVQDNLLVWYPMIEGNPESPQSIVYDHSEKGLGSELSNKDFTGWTLDGSSNWSASSATLLSHTASSAGFASSPFSTLSGKIYKVSITINSGQTGTYKLQLGGSSWLIDPVDGNDTWSGSYTFYVSNAGSSSNGFKIYAPSSFVGTFTDVSIKEVLMGNHATTNFFGDELITNGDFASDANWTKGDGWSIGSSVATSDPSAQSATSYLKSASFTALSTSKTYRLSYTVVRNAGTVDFIGMGGSDSQLTHRTASGTYSEDFVPSGANTQIWVVSVDGGFDGTVDNVSLKEVGISSSGFETAVNEPVVPQVPLMKYNQKMLFDGANTYLNPSLSTLSLTDDWSISVWFVANSRSGNQSIIAQSANASNRLGITITASGTVIGNMYDGSAYITKSSTAVSVSTMNHVVFTNSNKTINLYLNGVTQTGGVNVGLNSGGSFNIGRNSLGSGAYFDGTIDDVSIFNTELTQTQVQELFNDGVALDATTHSKKGNLLGYWRNDGVTTWQDRKGWSYLDFVTNDYVSNSSAITAFGTNPFSVSVWARTDSSNQDGLFANAGSLSGDYFFFSINPIGSLGVGIGTSTAWKHKYNTSEIVVDKWHLITYVREGTGTNQSKWYIDGSLVDTATDSTNWLTGNGWHIGAYGNSIGNLDGAISQLAIFHNKALSASEVSEQYTNGISTNFTTSGMTHHWVLNDGTTIIDKIAGNNGTVSGATYVSGDGDVQGTPDSITIREGLNQNRDGLGFYFTNPSSNVLRLNGVDEYVVAPDTDLSLSEQITIECWAKNNSDDLATDEYLVSQYETTSGANRSWLFRMLSDEKLRVVWSSNGTNYSLTATSSAITNVDTWRHYVTTIASGVAKIYVDGDAQTIDSIYSSGGLQTSLHNTVSNIFVGRIANDSNTNWNGLIDEVKIYNRALSLAEIQKNYKHQKGKHKND